MNQKDIDWLQKENIWYDDEDLEYDGYYYIGGYEYQYQYTHEDEYGFPELECVTTSPFLVAKYRSKSLPILIRKIRELNRNNGHRSDGEGASGVNWGYCRESEAMECDYLPKEWITLEEINEEPSRGFY